MLLVLFSGKRKSGKDFLSEKLLEKIGSEFGQIIRISEPIKAYFANAKQLDLSELLSDGPYKEQYRKEMIVWSDDMRQKNYKIFCEEAMKKVNKPIVIVSDIRRKTDVKYFTENFGTNLITIRVNAKDSIRQKRGYIFENGIDNVTSECDLDDFTDWTYNIDNDQLNDDGDVNELLMDIIIFIKDFIKENL